MDFNISRVWYLLKLDTVFGHRKFWMAAGAVFGVMMMVAISWAYDRDNDVNFFHETFYPLVLFIGGFLYSSISFRDLDEPATAINYLMLPASNLEKFTTKWLLSTIGFVLFSILFYGFFAFSSQFIASTFFDVNIWSFNPFSTENWLNIRLYIVIQSLFFLGAIAFRGYTAFKTVISVFLFNITVGAIIILIARVLWADYFDGWKLVGPQVRADIELRPSTGFEDFVEGPLWSIVQFLFWVVLPLTLWTASFFKLKEKEL